MASGAASNPSRREVELKSGGGAWARMWRTCAARQHKNTLGPSVALDGRGRLLLMFTLKGDEAAGPALVLARSDDGGRTWSDPVTAHRPSRGVPRALGTMTRLRTGELVAPFEEAGIVRLLVSRDDGASWDSSPPIDCSPLQEAVPYGRLVEANDELLMPLFGKQPVAGRAAPASGLLRSRDGGRTWGDFTAIACDRAEGRIEYGPTAVHTAPDGTMLALITVGRREIHRSLSSDGGRTWSAPERRILSSNASLAALGRTLACVTQDPLLGGLVRVYFSEDLFDSWVLDRHLSFNIGKGDYSSAVALDPDRLLLVHDRGDARASASYRATVVTGGLEGDEGFEVAAMQRNPEFPPPPRKPTPAEKRDRWELVEKLTIPVATGLGEMTVAPDGRLLSASGGRVYCVTDMGKTFREIARVPVEEGHPGVFAVLRSGRWLAAYTLWPDVSDESSMSRRRPIDTADGYGHYQTTDGAITVNEVRLYRSDDQGKTWQGGPIDISPLVWSCPYGRVIEEDDGTLALTTYGCLSAEDALKRLDVCGLYRSADGGQSWGDFSIIARDERFGEFAYNETDVQPMPDGTWVALFRTHWRMHGVVSTSRSFSEDRGRTWSRPRWVFTGGVPDMALLPDGALAWVGSTNRIRISYDGGYTWSVELPAFADIGGGAGYPGMALVDGDHLFVCGRWQGRAGCLYRRVPAAAR